LASHFYPCPIFFNVTVTSTTALLDHSLTIHTLFPAPIALPRTMDALLPKPAAQALAAVGLLYLTSKVWSFLRLLASLFILPGESVRNPNTSQGSDC
jgi:hypothetical protein